MSEVPDYILDAARDIDKDAQRLARIVHDISLIKQDIRRLTESLDGAEKLEAALSEALPLRARALELLCKDQGWPYPEPPATAEEPPPAGPQEAAARKAHAAAPGTTAANPMPPAPDDVSGAHPILGKQGVGVADHG